MYNNGFIGYQPQKNGINWVQGIEGAKAFQLPPNSNTVLMDSENDGIFYIKICDNIGMCSLRKFRYQEIIDEPQPQPNQYVTRNELMAILKEMKNEQAIPATNTNIIKSESSDEHAKGDWKSSNVRERKN